jgi:hypothetical protein
MAEEVGVGDGPVGAVTVVTKDGSGYTGWNETVALPHGMKSVAPPAGDQNELEEEGLVAAADAAAGAVEAGAGAGAAELAADLACCAAHNAWCCSLTLDGERMVLRILHQVESRPRSGSAQQAVSSPRSARRVRNDEKSLIQLEPPPKKKIRAPTRVQYHIQQYRVPNRPVLGLGKTTKTCVGFRLPPSPGRFRTRPARIKGVSLSSTCSCQQTSQ